MKIYKTIQQEIKELKEKGYSLNEISEKTGIIVSNIKNLTGGFKNENN